MKRLFFVFLCALFLAACHHKNVTPGRVGQMYFSSVSFDVNGDDIHISSYKQIDEAVKVFKKNPTAQIEVRGYTDASGNEKQNIRLSQKRAEKVSKALQIRGISPEKISAKGFGSQKPIASNNTPEGRKQNRRVEIEFPYPAD